MEYVEKTGETASENVRCSDIGLQPDSLLQCGYRSAYYFKSVSGPGNAGCKGTLYYMYGRKFVDFSFIHIMLFKQCIPRFEQLSDQFNCG